MKQNIRYLGVLLLGLLVLQFKLLAQNKPGILHLKNNNFTSYFNLGIDWKKDLTDKGNTGEATIEFWVRSVNAGNSWTLTDLSDNSQGFNLSMSSENTITFNAVSGDAGFIEHNLWHHVAVVLQANKISVYVNGQKKLTDITYATPVSATNLHLVKNSSEQLMLTELRGWNRRRSDIEIADNQWRSYIFESDFELADLHSVEGLEILYGTDNATTSTNANLDFTNLQWHSISGSANGLAAKQGKGIAAAKVNTASDERADLLEISNSTDHPVLENQTIFLKASKGKYDDKITLEWPHIDNIDGYNIYKNRTLINTIQDVRIRVSERISFEDESVLPGELYTYRVEGYSNEDNAFRPDAIANGFIFPNGRINGNVKTESEIFVENVRVNAFPKNGTIPGSALQFSSSSQAINVSQIQVFRDHPSFTVEFWYRSSESVTNEVFSIGTLSVSTSSGSIQVNNGISQILIEATNLAVDDQWHHVAVVVADGNNQLYRDGKRVAENNSPFIPDLSGFNRFLINANASGNYQLDEFRVWAGARDSLSIANNYNHIISGRESGLLLYYRFDMKDGEYIYNQAIQTKGYYIGESLEELSWLSEWDQPEIVYGTYTDSGGNYSLEAINMGIDPEGLNFVTSLYKANHTFNPAQREKRIRRSLERADYAKEADFIDISSIPLSGNVLYQEGGNIYPAIQGLQFTIDGNLVQGTDQNLVTDNSGAYSIGAPLGKHKIAIYNPELDISPGVQSLRFDGIDDYAKMESFANYQQDGIWSGWVKKGSSQSPEQVLLSIGELHLVLKNNRELILKTDSTVLIGAGNQIDSEWSFFAVSYEESTQKLRLYVNDLFTEIDLPTGTSLSGEMMLGASKSPNPTNYFEGSLYLIEYRNQYLDAPDVNKIREGEIIENDPLEISYSFEETNPNTIRVNSITRNAEDYVLGLQGAVVDGENIHTYTRKFKYKYKAQGDLMDPEDSSQFDFNIVTSPKRLNFHNETRFGIVGNLIIPCGYNIGLWDVVVKRTDILSPEFSREFIGTAANDIFNSDPTVFSVPDLLPGHYKVFLTNQEDPSIILESPIIDLTSGWKQYEFVYRGDMEITYNIFGEVSEIIPGATNSNGQFASITFDNYDDNCSSKIILESGKIYGVAVNTFEAYGSKTCPVEDLDFHFSGDLAKITARPAGIGKDTMLIQALEPNFTGDYTRSLDVRAKQGDRSAYFSINAVNTGARQFSNDFTLKAPPTIIAVLHDPPGDQSYASLSGGTSYSFEHTYSNAGGVDIKTDVSTGIDNSITNGVWAGVGAGSLILFQEVFTSSNQLFSITSSYVGGKEQSTNETVSLERTISTASGVIPGIRSDVFVAKSEIIHLGNGKSVEADGCAITMKDRIQVIKPHREPIFSVTYQHVKDVIIPNLERALKDSSFTATDSAQYLWHIDEWKKILRENDDLYTDHQSIAPNPFEFDNPNNGEKLGFPESIAFSGGQSTAYSLSRNSSNTDQDNHDFEGTLEKEFSFSTGAFGPLISFKTNVKAKYLHSESFTNASDSSTVYSFELSDDDLGDQFDLLIRKDERNLQPTPLFITQAGRSMCPFEPGTQSRQGVEIKMQTGESSFGEGNLDDRIAFKALLINDQVAHEAAGTGYYKTYKVKAYNRKGAIVRLNGSLLGEGGTDVVLETEGPESIKEAVISVSRNPDAPELTEFENISIVMFAPCEESEGSLGFFDPATAGTEMTDTLYISAKFHEPCVEKLDVRQPQQNWVVNGSSQNQLYFEFLVENPHESFESLILEYGDPSSNTGSILSEISYAALQSTADSLNGKAIYSFHQDVSALPDGQYQFRLVPSCGPGTEKWRKQTATDWVKGSIYRSAPVITEVTPAENTILKEGLVSATYDRPITPVGVNSLNISLRGILGGDEYQPRSAEFNHGGDFIKIPHHTSVSIDSAFTIELWLKVNVMPAGEVNILNKGSNYQISLNADGTINNGRAVSTAVTPGEWIHLAVVYDGNHHIKTYLDGSEVSELSQVASFPVNTDSITIGGDGFIGQIDEIRIWDIVRDHSEINSYERDRFIGNEPGLQAYYVLDDIALEGEAIRDYTGKTYGTESNSISWVSGEEAAPIEVKKVVQDIPIDVILSGERQILINPKSNFPTYYLEGAQLTAFITDQSISDVYGNKAPGKSWHFVIDRNAVRWNRNNYTISQEEGSGQTFTMEIFNEGATNATYELIDLPNWLQVVGKNENVKYELPYGFVHAIQFKTADWMEPGLKKSHIKAVTYDLEGARTGLESFYLEVEVKCPSPSYSFNSNAYSEQMLITGRLLIDGALSVDNSDKVVAYIGGEIRGVSSPISSVIDSLFQITVFGEVGESETISFKVWDALKCKEYDGILENYTFVAGTTLGSAGNPVDFTASSIEVNRYSLDEGYHWISFNQADYGQNYLSLSAIAGMQAGDSLYTQSGHYATYDGAWTGSLTQIDPLQSYVYYAATSRELSVTGEVLSLNTNIPLTTGINWVSYLPAESQPVHKAFQSITGGSNFMVVGKGSYAEYSADGWVGSLTNLVAGEGYRLVMSTPDILNYTGNVNASATRNVAAEDPENMKDKMTHHGWEVNQNEYSAQMYITFELMDNQFATDENYLIGAFINDELRGVAIPQKIDGAYQYFMVVNGNQGLTDSVKFKLKDADGRVKNFSNRLNFEVSKSVGSYEAPYRLELSEYPLEGLALSQNYPNPFDELTTIQFSIPNAGRTSLKIYDQTGRIVDQLMDKQTEAGSYQVEWNASAANHKAGIYFYELIHNGERIVKKLILN